MQVSPRILWRDADVSALVPYGWADDVASRIATIAAAVHSPARVIRVDRGSVVVATPDGVAPCRTSSGGIPATVGDWVVVRQEPGLGLVLDGIVDRRTAITRRDPSGVGSQVLAANVDTVLITVAIDRPLRASRLERSLVLVWDSGASPAVVLTKRDLVSEAEVSAALEGARDIASGVDVLAVSAATGDGCSALFRYAGVGATVALVGASGAGKSTLANRLIGEQVLDTGHTRHVDGKGRHTTTARELIPLTNGGVLIDTPGLRAVGLAGSDGGVAHVFSDIDELGDACRFRDCRHTAEPGCAVQDAIEAGELSDRRYRSYQKILREQSHVARREAERKRRDNARGRGKRLRSGRRRPEKW